MKIVAYVHGAWPHLPAGSEVMLHSMMRALAAAGHECHYVTTVHGDPAWSTDGIQGARVSVEYANASIADLAPDVVVSHHDRALHGIDIAADVGAASVAVLHNDFALTRPIVAARPDLLVYNTRWLRERVSPRGCRNILIRPPVTPPAVPDGPRDRVTMVNLHHWKGPDMFWRIAQSLPQVEFLAVRGAYGPAQQDIRDLANVEVIDPTTDMAGAVWSRTRLVVAPSRYESYGMAACEAMSAGIPVVAAPTPGLRESLGRAGLFERRCAVGPWVHRVSTLLADDAAYGRVSAAGVRRGGELMDQCDRDMRAWVRSVEALVM